MIGNASFNMIPGVQLLDKNFILQVDSTGHNPKHNLYQELLPKVQELLKRKKNISGNTGHTSAKIKLTSTEKKNVEETYKRLKVNQVSFDPKVSTLPETENSYLDKMFNLTDLAAMQRVQTLDWFWTAGKQGKNFKHYEKQIDPLLQKMKQTEPPEKLKNFHAQILEAIELQNDFFAETDKTYKKENPFQFNAGNPLIQKSSSKLKQAWGELKRLYPKESEANQKSFYAHLCCLDFI